VKILFIGVLYHLVAAVSRIAHFRARGEIHLPPFGIARDGVP
jgi:hypothetical protein